MISFTSLTREVGIGANSYVLEVGGARVVLDAGMHPKKEGAEALPRLDLVAGTDADAIFISHCHLDHIGSLPVLMRELPGARVFMTQATARLGDAMLHNSINVMTRQRDELGISEYPFYTHRETDRLAQRWNEIPLRTPMTLDGERAGADERGVTFEFYEAGHIPGAAGILFRAEGRSVFYTGDVLFEDQNITRGARFPEEPVDALIIETTRGDSPANPEITRESEIERLGRAISETHDSGGSVLLPVFALGKTQEMLVILHLLKGRGAIRDCAVYIGGLSTKITGIVDSLRNRIPRLRPGFGIIDEVRPFSLDGAETASMPLRGGRIYTLSSGMMNPGTLSHTLARRLLPEPGHAIYFVGYADPDSPAGKIKAAWRAGASEVDLGDNLPPLPARCRIDDFSFSGHASRDALLDFIKSARPKTVLLVHGDRSAIGWFEGRLAEEMPGARVVVPEPGERIEI